MLVEDELEPPLGLLDDDEAPPLDDEPLIAPPDEEPDEPDEPPLIAPPDDAPLPPALLDEPPVPEVDDESDDGGVEGVVDDDEDELPGAGTTVVDEEDEPPLGVVEVDPPGTTVVDSFFSHAESANAPISTNTYPLYFIFTLLSSESHTTQKCTAGLAIDVPAPGNFPLQRRSVAVARTTSSSCAKRCSSVTR